MILRGLLICSVGIGATSLMIGTCATAIAQKDVARGELGSCAGYFGLPSEDGASAGMAFIRGGTFVMGSERQRPEERFTHAVPVDGFWIDRHEVTNAQFREFVAATGYVTLAERGLDPATHLGAPKELLVPGSVVFIAAHQRRGRRADHAVVAVRARGQLARADRSRHLDCGQRQSSSRAYRLRGCARVCALARA
jgi:formylglycine-generating enzyme